MVGVTQEAVNFNPLLYVNTGVETCVEFTVFDSLWKIDPQGKFIPNLATEIPTVENGGVSKDGLIWTIKLRPDVTWHDGPAVFRRRRRLHARRHHEPESGGAQPSGS